MKQKKIKEKSSSTGGSYFPISTANEGRISKMDRLAFPRNGSNGVCAEEEEWGQSSLQFEPVVEASAFEPGVYRRADLETRLASSSRAAHGGRECRIAMSQKFWECFVFINRRRLMRPRRLPDAPLR